MKQATKVFSLSLIALVCFLFGNGFAQTFGPYVVTRTLASPPGGVGDLEFAGGYLYSLEGYMGNIHKLDPATGNVLADYWVPVGSLHDDLPYDGPTGLAWDGTNMWMATYAPNYLRKLTLQGAPNVTVDATYSLSSWPMDLAYVNGLLMYPEYPGPIGMFDPVTGTVVGSIPSPSDYIYGLTFDGRNLLAGGGAGAGAGDIWVISPQDGSIVDTWHTGLLGINGLAYDDQTSTLYIASYNAAGIVVAQIVPEPATWSLLALGVGALLDGCRMRRRSS